MRRFTAILLLFIMSFSILGGYGLFLSIWHTNEQKMLRSFDDQSYDEADAVTFSFYHGIAYVVEQPDFIRVDGEFTHEGEYYRIVKQRVSSDSIFVVGIKDNHSQRIINALTDYVKTFTDQHDQDKHTSTIKINFSKEYYNLPFSLVTLSLGWETDVLQHGQVKTFHSRSVDAAIQPPEAA